MDSFGYVSGEVGLGWVPDGFVFAVGADGSEVGVLFGGWGFDCGVAVSTGCGLDGVFFAVVGFVGDSSDVVFEGERADGVGEVGEVSGVF